MRWFPILQEVGIGAIPWEMIEPCEAQAKRNHDQSLERLAERGGLGASEAVCVLNGQSLRDMLRDNKEAVRVLIHKRDAWMAVNRVEEIETLRSALAAVKKELERAQDTPLYVENEALKKERDEALAQVGVVVEALKKREEDIDRCERAEGCLAWTQSDNPALVNLLPAARKGLEEREAERKVVERARLLVRKLLNLGFGRYAVVGAEIANADESLAALDAAKGPA
jgi:hypothetical protein